MSLNNVAFLCVVLGIVTFPIDVALFVLCLGTIISVILKYMGHVVSAILVLYPNIHVSTLQGSLLHRVDPLDTVTGMFLVLTVEVPLYTQI